MFSEWPTHKSQEGRYDQQSVYGQLLFAKAKKYESAIIKWHIQFCMIKSVDNPLYIGITNHSTFRNRGPQHSNFKKSQYWTGFELQYLRGESAGSISVSKFVAMGSSVDPHRERHNRVSEDTNFDTFMDCQFGEIKFTARIDQTHFGTGIEVYLHPHTIESEFYQASDMNWTQHGNLKQIGMSFLGISLPVGASVQLMNVEIENANMHCIQRPEEWDGPDIIY